MNFRFNTISTIPDFMSICCNSDDPVRIKQFGKYQVDDSSFVPMSEAVKRVSGGTLTPEQVKSMYDFSNGRDTGAKVPVDRTHRFSGDIAEASMIARETSAKVREGVIEARKQFEFEQKVNALNNDSTSATSQE